jgi:hypothetical protein
MKLITEYVQDGLQVITEASENGTKRRYITGIFMQAEQKNRNNRIYPLSVLSKEVERYGRDYVAKNRAFGELGHPDGPAINAERISHIITSLKMEGNNAIGKAKICNTPYGNIVNNLLEDGGKFGVSSRGLGSLSQTEDANIVQEDFILSTVDIVIDPSAPDAFVDGIMEGREWVWNNGVLTEQKLVDYKKKISQTSSQKLEEQKLKIFSDFLRNLKNYK